MSDIRDRKIEAAGRAMHAMGFDNNPGWPWPCEACYERAKVALAAADELECGVLFLEASDRIDKLETALRDIIDHATPLGSDSDEFVSTGYVVSVGCIHRAMGLI